MTNLVKPLVFLFFLHHYSSLSVPLSDQPRACVFLVRSLLVLVLCFTVGPLNPNTRQRG